MREKNLKDQMITVASSYMGFCKERKWKNLEDLTNFGVKSKIQFLEWKKNTEGHDTNIKTAQSLQQMVYEYCVGSFSGNDFLFELLRGRFAYLKDRKEKKDIIYIPGTFEQDLQTLENKKTQKGDYNRQLAIASIDRFQMLNKLIVFTFLDSGSDNLKDETKDLLRASVSLHSVILGKSDDLGHPDAAIYRNYSNSRNKKIKKSDFGYYYSCIEEGVLRMMPSNWCYYEQAVTRNTYYRDKNFNRVRDINLDLPEIEWIEETNLFDCLVHPHNIKIIKPEITTVIEPEITTIIEPEITTVIEPEITTVIEPEITTIIEPESTAIIEPESTAIIEPESTAIIEPEITTVIEPEITTIIEPEITTIIEPEITTIIEPEAISRKDIIDIQCYVPPKGMRNFHNHVNYDEIFGGRNRYLELNIRYQNIVDEIFAKNFEGIKFRHFKSLWEYINGKNKLQHSKSGGSHIKLLDQDGHFAGSTFAHGNNHEYTKSTVPYLIDALIRSGVWPQ